MGAVPRYVMLALTLPGVDEAWLAAFSRGFFALADSFQVELIGGDTTRGPLAMSLTIFGEVEAGRALRRDGAAVGDDIWVSGELGAAALALLHLLGRQALERATQSSVNERLHRPMPRVRLGRALIGVASAAIDISDGLLADLGHVCERSQLAATIDHARLPAAAELAQLSEPLADACMLSGGDDYELCFTASPGQRERIDGLSRELQLPLTRVGSMRRQQAKSPMIRVLDPQRRERAPATPGYDPFVAGR
jgi:thiamine-monophosphate kinase